MSFYFLLLGSRQKKWHQDNEYFCLMPARVVVSQADSNFFTIIDYSPWSKRENLPNLKTNFISETREATPTKIGVQAFDISSYLHADSN